MQPEPQGEGELWLPSAVSKMFGEHALLGSEVSQPTGGGRAAPLQMGAGGSAKPERVGARSCPPRPSVPPSDPLLLERAWSQDAGLGHEPHCLFQEAPPTGSGEPTPR